MHLSDAVSILADTTGASRGRFEIVARRLQEASMLPKSEGGSNRPTIQIEHAILILLGHLSGAAYADLAATVSRLVSYRSDGERGEGEALPFITRMLSALVDLDMGLKGKFAYHSAISVVSGDRPAIVVRVSTNEEDPLELVFTPGGEHWQPHLCGDIVETRTLPGRVLFRISHGIRSLFPPKIEHRTFPVEVAA